MKTERFVIAVLAAAFAAAASAESVFYGPDYWQKRTRPWIGAAFTNATAGADLSDEGATGGSWGIVPVPERASAKVVEENGLKFISFDTQEAISNLVFTADSPKTQPLELKFSMRYTEDGESLVDLSDVAKAAFTVSRPGEGKLPGFFGFTKGGWVQLSLPSGKLEADFNIWYDISMRLIDGCSRVTYALKTDAGYENLVDVSGKDTFDAAEGGVNMSGGEFELRGKADFTALESTIKNTGITIKVNE